jgi:catechol 2,3-dioxygenase-like lactoylglutathione lyase family enzyme
MLPPSKALINPPAPATLNPSLNQAIKIAAERPEKGQLKCLHRSVGDLQRTQEFYRALFDLKTTEQSDAQLTLSDGFTQLHFHLDADMRGPSVGKAANAMALIHPNIETRNNHLAFGGADFANLKPTLAARKIPYETFAVPDTELFQTFFFDPDGHLLEITEASLKVEIDSKFGWGVQHISHLSNTLAEDCRFIEDVLGFNPMPRPGFEAKGAWYTDGFIEYHLVQPSARSFDFFSDKWEVGTKTSLGGMAMC